MTEVKLMNAFSTPVQSCIFSDCAETNEGLKALILARADSQPKTARSNVGGWNSAADLLEWGGPHVERLKTWIRAALKSMTEATGGAESAASGDFVVSAWANVLYSGSYNQVHNHNGFAWSGVYYVDPGEVSPGDGLDGRIEFIDPRAGVGAPTVPGDPFDQRLVYNPGAGHMMMFPGWLMHTVHVYRGQRPRISIPFNVSFHQRDRNRP